MPKVVRPGTFQKKSAHGAGSSAKNYFAALDSDDETNTPKLQLGPSIFQRVASGGDVSLDSLTAQSSSSSAASESAAAVSSSSINATSSGASAPAAGLDLASVANELFEESKNVAATAAEAAWDFTGLASTAGDRTLEEKAEMEAMEAKQKIFENHIARLQDSDKQFLVEKMNRTEMSYKQRARKVAELERGRDFADKTSSKFARKKSRTNLRNKVKHM